MKTKFLLAGLCTSVAFVSCTNEELLNVEENSPVTSDYALICDGVNVPAGSRMSFVNGDFKWDLNSNGVTDEIGVLRTIDGTNVVSNSKFTVAKVKDDLSADWTTNATGKYAYFTTNVETIFEGNYVMTYPWDKTLNKDGKIVATLDPVQAVGATNQTSYVAKNGFMMSTITKLDGGQEAGHFSLYPVFGRLRLHVKGNEAELQSVILRSKGGEKKAAFPTELEIPANVSLTSDELLNEKDMKVVEGSGVDQIVMTMDEAALSNTATDLYMTLLPGTYSNVEILLVTDKGSYIYNTKETEVTLGSGRYADINIDLTNAEFSTNRTYYVATANDWNAAMTNISKLTAADGSHVTVNIIDDIDLSQATATLRNNGTSSTKVITVNSDNDSKITVSNDNGIGSYVFGDVTFNVPVYFKGSDYINYTSIANDKVVFNKGLYAGALNLITTSTTTINGGYINSTTSIANNSELTANEVEFKDKVTVETAAVVNNSYNVVFNKSSFVAGLTMKAANTDKILLNECTFDDNDTEAANSTLKFESTSSKYGYAVLTGNVNIENIDLQGTTGVLEIADKANVVISNKATITAASNEIRVLDGGTLTFSEDVEYTLTATELKVEGIFNNNGTLTINAGGQLTDVKQDQHKGQVYNNGTVKVPVTKIGNWYANQNIEVVSSNKLVATSIANADNLVSAINNNATGVVVTYKVDFTDNTIKSKDFSNIDFEIASTASSIEVFDGLKLGNLTIDNNATIAADATAQVTVKDFVINLYNQATVSNTQNQAVTINANNVDVKGTLVNGSQVTYTGKLSATGTIKGGQPVKK